MCFSWRRFGATKTVSGSQQQRTALILKRCWLGRASGSEILSSKKFQKNSHTVPVWFHSETIRDPAIELERSRRPMLFELGAARLNGDLERELVRARLLIFTAKAAKPPHLSAHRDTGGS